MVFGTPEDTVAIEVLWNNVGLFEAVLQTSADDPAAPYVCTRHCVLDVGSPHALELARMAIDECVHGHERCAEISPPSDVRLPTRLVDCSNPSHPRLVLTERKRGRYLALSYVWGEPQPHRTTTSNLSAYTRGIDASRLPQTIRDAVFVTHALGLRYLWVDSLCIVQDSDEDKVHEISYMHLIYRHAYLTIVAASSRTVNEGFLQKRSKEDVIEVTLPFQCPPQRSSAEEGVAPVDVRRVGQVLISLSEMSSWPVRTGEPIDERGWCLQEFAMSPRKLNFTSKTLQYTCQESARSVDNSFLSRRGYTSIAFPNILFSSLPPPLAQESKEWHNVHAAWCLTVTEYTGRTLGRYSDKLVACGALAEAFHRVLRTDYLAGLWRRTLLGDLLWEHDYPEYPLLRRSMEYRAPSWSWAAVDGEVVMRWLTFPQPDATALAEVLHCEVTLKNAELPFSEVTGGSLVLRAALTACQAQVCWDERYDEVWLPFGATLPGLFRLDRYADDEDEAAVRDCYLVPLVRTAPSRPLLHGLQDPYAQGIIVALADTFSTPGIANTNGCTYHRIGSFRAYCWDTAWQDNYDTLPREEIEIV